MFILIPMKDGLGIFFLCFEVAKFSSWSIITLKINVSGQRGYTVVWDSLSWKNLKSDLGDTCMQFLKKHMLLGPFYEIYVDWGLIKNDTNTEIGWNVDKLLIMKQFSLGSNYLLLRQFLKNPCHMVI